MSKTSKQSRQSAIATTKSKEGSPTDAILASEVMQAVLSRPRAANKLDTPIVDHISGVIIGTLSEQAENGQPLVQYPGNPSGEPVPAISTVQMTEQDLDHEVALSFVEGNPTRPIILGLIQKIGPKQQTTTDEKVNVHIDGEKLTLTADREIVLKCGKSSITLTRAGKIIVKGAYLSNYSTGVNRIKGGSVQIN
ncbi:MAG: DUF6484 domain-containing protein [Xanthomonadales bacterium]|nr:DUF6484 domain-containing protein [Xanthomonadales bacterium]